MGGRDRQLAWDIFRALASASLLIAACADADAERLPIKAYSVENGLAHNRVKRIVQDSHGFLWFCTGGGLSRFDGSIRHLYGRRRPARGIAQRHRRDQ